MTRSELVKFRQTRWKYLRTGRCGGIVTPEYVALNREFWHSADRLDGVQRVVYIGYYYEARSIVYLSMVLNYTDRQIKRIKKKALEKIILR